ncbi:glycosyltransferase [candidate division KSB1 bacterium]|nr:glycosyltransferase [candidate division KSB1 bacterium]
MKSSAIIASVILPSYRQKAVICDALESILQQETDFVFEVIVVDSSDDDTAELVRQRFPQVKLIELKQRAFPGTARNEAIRIAQGRFFAFTDTDCVVDKKWLQHLVETHRRGYRVVGGLVRNGTPYSLAGTCDYLLEFSNFIATRPTENKSHFGTCNVSFDKDIFQEYGFFADQVKGSDSMYTRLLRSHGEKFYYQPSAVIWHHNRTRLKNIFQNQYDLGYGAAINRQRYNLAGKEFVRYPILIPLLPLSKFSAISFRLLKYRFVDFVKFLVLSPLALSVLSVYTVGFARGRKYIVEAEKKAAIPGRGGIAAFFKRRDVNPD